MTDHTDVAHRTRRRGRPGETSVREADRLGEDAEDGMMSLRLPIASTGEVRNEGDEPLTRAELEGMAAQVDELTTGVFPEHGDSDIVTGGLGYSQFEKLGYWADAEIEQADDGEDLLMAEARMPDPETLPQTVGDYREALAILKEQAKRDIPMDASIGWRDDDSRAGGVDLLEASIVGIGADPRTTSQGVDSAGVVARAAVAAGADPEALVETVRDAVADERPLGPPEDPDRFDTFDECVAALSDDPDLSEADAEQICGAWEQAKSDQAARVEGARAEYEVGDTTVTIDPPEAMVNAADLAMQKSDEGLGSDCGTGVGDERADQIRNDAVGPDVVAEIAAYLTSHEEDVTAEGPPSEWSDEEWDDCGNIQYAKWGGTGSGEQMAWAQARANDVADARGEDLPYPDRRNLDDPAFAEGDAVTWSWDGEPVHGRVAQVGAEFTVAGNTITGDEGEAVYLIHEWDESVEAFRRENVAKPESSLSESQLDMPPASDDNFQAMTNPDDSGDDPEPDGEQTAPDDGAETTRAPEDIDEPDIAEFVSEVYDGVDAADIQAAMNDAGAEFTGLTTETVGWFVADILDMTAGEVQDMVEEATDGENEMDGDGEDDDEDDMDEQGADLADEVQSLREELDEVRAAIDTGDASVDTPEESSGDDDDGTTERDADDSDDEATGEPAAPNWRGD